MTFRDTTATISPCSQLAEIAKTRLMNRIPFALIIVSFCMTLSGCGQKGPLILPEDAEQGQARIQQAPSAQQEAPHVAFSLQE